ncbi:hypothetical protein LWI29_010190 [Acer saccharum]|uniref:Uncharacterized protein n=1 Tax=Acer saccharum TaxID=4024 RepID=A0AA39TPR0_ACESA|nr:hypothetical protein LWI29_010190 [Acer saccharum]
MEIHLLHLYEDPNEDPILDLHKDARYGSPSPPPPITIAVAQSNPETPLPPHNEPQNPLPSPNRVFIHGTARVLDRGVQVEDYRVGFKILFLFGVVMYLMRLILNLFRIPTVPEKIFLFPWIPGSRILVEL